MTARAAVRTENGILRAALGCVVLALAGCAGDPYSELGLVQVSGKVTLDGRPLANAKVAFEGEDKGSSIGITDSAGNYTLNYDSERAGVKPGPKIVRITLADAEVEGGGVSEGAEAKKESIPARYNTQSELKADVSASKRTFDFELKSGP
jgi:hypothetical protein